MNDQFDNPEDLIYQLNDASSKTSSFTADDIMEELRLYGMTGEKYQIEGEIGRGGMSTIFKAYDMGLKRTVVLKVLLPEMVNDAKVLAQFVDEARITSHLEHPNIISVNEIGILTGNDVFFSMEYVHGEELNRILRKLKQDDEEAREKYTLFSLLTIFRKVCDACAFAHSKGIIHRDIKPENVMIGNYGEAILMDWGVATFEDPVAFDETAFSESQCFRPFEDLYTTNLNAQFIGGTPSFMSPEQAQVRLEDIDRRTDVFLLGATLYAVATLCEPYEGQDIKEILGYAQNCNIIPPEVRAPERDIPPDLIKIIGRAMMYDPADRYQTVEELCVDLDAVMSGQTALLKKYFKKGHYLIRENEVANEAYVILNGAVEVFKIVAGNKVKLGELRAGDSIGEMALISAESRSASVIAIAETEVAVIDKDIMDKGLEKLAPWMNRVIQTLVDRLRTITENPGYQTSIECNYQILVMIRLLFPLLCHRVYDSDADSYVLFADRDTLVREVALTLSIPPGRVSTMITKLREVELIRIGPNGEIFLRNYFAFCMFVTAVSEMQGEDSHLTDDERVTTIFANDRELVVSMEQFPLGEATGDLKQVKPESIEDVFGCNDWDQLPLYFTDIYERICGQGTTHGLF